MSSNVPAVKYITHPQVFTAAKRVADALRIRAESTGNRVRVYAIPRGGVPALYAVLTHCAPEHVQVVGHPADAHYLIDDLVDSGGTARRYREEYGTETVPLFHKQPGEGWYVFPWETKEGDGPDTVHHNVTRLLEYVGEDPHREGLVETPARFVRAWDKYTEGYKLSAADVLKVFEDGGENYDEMVLVKDIPFYSHCEHHLAPFFGTATIAYIPDGRIVGLSKLSRLLDVYARRLQVQERLTAQVADALLEHLAPRGVGVLVRARHLCMESRGVCKQGHHTTTSALRGVLKVDPAARAEFMSLA